VSEEVFGALSALLASQEIELVDLTVGSGLVRVTVDRPGGVDLDCLAGAHQRISAALDELDPLPGRYTLEVTSPGVEHPLREAGQFVRAVGQTVEVRGVTGAGEGRPQANPGEARREGGVGHFRGVLASADADGIVMEGPEVPGGSLRLRYGEVEDARTVLEWGPRPRPGGGRSGKRHKSQQKKVETTGGSTGANQAAGPSQNTRTERAGTR
jgi:ribosome maturation factor RimP